MRDQLNQIVPVNGQRLRGYRRQNNWTQMELAKASGMSRSYIADLENGRKQPRYLVADELAEALGVEVDDLVSTKPLATPGYVWED